jgi:methylglyoxal synthase
MPGLKLRLWQARRPWNRPRTGAIARSPGSSDRAFSGIVDGRIDFVIFFWDPLEPQPHDVDVKALLRIAVVHNVPIACNRATADFVLSSPLMHRDYERLVDRLPHFSLDAEIRPA